MPVISAEQAIRQLSNSDVVALPTETVYGLAGRIDHDDTLRRIFTVKSRPFFDPLIVHVTDLAQAKTLVSQWPEIYDLLAKEFWPGPLTLIAPRNAKVSPLITAGLDSVGLRSPAHPIIREILEKVGVPLAAPSANKFGRTSPTKAAHVISEFADTVSVVDGGDCEVGVESTVLTAKLKNNQWQVEILRPGGVSQRQIADCLNKNKVPFTLQRAHSVASPGHTSSHYQPESPVVILHSPLTDDQILHAMKEENLEVKEIRRLKLPDEPVQAARVLYQNFRDLSLPSSAIIVERKQIHAGEDWQAVWDRIDRASVLHL